MAQTSSSPSRTWIWTIVVLFLTAGLLYFALFNSRDKITVTTARVERQDLVRSVPTNGRVEPLSDFQAHAPAPSTVQGIDVHIGQQVSPGQALVQLDQSEARLRVATAKNNLQQTEQDLQNLNSGGTHDELLAERANLTDAEAQLKDATASLQSLKLLQAKGAASANEVAAAQGRVTAAQMKADQVQTRLQGRYGAGDLATARSQVGRAQQELSTAQDDYGQFNIHTPIAGTVYFLPVTRFDYVSAGEALISVADLKRLQVRAFFDEPDVGLLAPGQQVRIVWGAKLDRVWHGHIKQVPTTITNAGNRSVGECLISVDDADGDLLPNTNVTVTVVISQRFNVLSLPREALHTQGADNFVFRIINGKLLRTPVSLGVVNLTRMEITGGLKQGDVVALSATTDTELENGLSVRAQP